MGLVGCFLFCFVIVCFVLFLRQGLAQSGLKFAEILLSAFQILRLTPYITTPGINLDLICVSQLS